MYWNYFNYIKNNTPISPKIKKDKPINKRRLPTLTYSLAHTFKA